MAAEPLEYRTMPAGEFKNRCLALMDEVNETNTEIVITKYGRPVSRLVPARRKAPEMWGRYREQVRITGDIVTPAVAAGEWEAVAQPATTLDPDAPPGR
jgi:prevent-host-death family protein